MKGEVSLKVMIQGKEKITVHQLLHDVCFVRKAIAMMLIVKDGKQK